jgi:hypothetical protein
MNYNRITITSAGGTITAKTLINGYEDIEIYSAAPVTLSAAVSITVSDLYPYAQFNIRWNANVSLNTYLLTICGVSITQDALNQTGTFICVYDGSTWSVQYFADGKDQPQAAQGVTDIPVPVGGTKTLTAGVDAAYQRLVGSPTTLTSNYTVTAGTTGIKAGSQFQIDIAGGITIGSNTLTVFGVSINANQALNGGVIIFATFDGVSTWVAASTSRPISTADIDPVTARSVMGNATNATAAPTDITFPTDYGVLQRNGTTLTTGLLTASNFAVGTPIMQLAVTTLSSAQILASFTTPIQLLAAAPNYYIIHKVIAIASYGGVAYTTNLDAAVYFNIGADDLYTATGLWGYTSSGGYSFFEYVPASASLQTPKSDPLMIRTLTGNPAAGTGTVQILVYYTAY